jgi:hypothetical protein
MLDLAYLAGWNVRHSLSLAACVASGSDTEYEHAQDEPHATDRPAIG